MSLEDLKRHTRHDVDEEDPLLEVYLEAAREHIETFARRGVLPGTYDLFRDCWPRDREVELPHPPGATITVDSVSYIDLAGAAQTVEPTEYELAETEPALRLIPAYGYCWPPARRGSIRIRFTAAYEAPAAIPAGIRHAAQLLVGHWNENREAVLTGMTSKQVELGVDALLWPHRLLSFA